MPLATTWRSDPSGRNETTAAEYSELGGVALVGDEMPRTIRPVGCPGQAVELTDAGREGDDRSPAGEGRPVEPSERVDSLMRRHEQLTVDPQQPERRVEIGDGLDRRGTGRRHEVDRVCALVLERGGRDPQPPLTVDRERRDVGEAGGIDRGRQAGWTLETGADVDEAGRGGRAARGGRTGRGRRRRRRGRSAGRGAADEEQDDCGERNESLRRLWAVRSPANRGRGETTEPATGR